MAQEQNKNIFAVPVMTGSIDDINDIEIPTFDADTDVIQGLDDEPNDVGGLSAQELKAKFDQVGNSLKTYINGSFIPAVIGTAASEQQRQANEAQRILNESGRVSAETARADAETSRVTAETNRSLFEEYDSTKAYVVGNKVAYLGSSYICILNTTAGINPLNTTYWLLIARKGVKGDTGDPGVTTATVTVGTSTGTPTASVTLNQVTREMAFAFDGLKGETGPKGDKGDRGEQGLPGGVVSINGKTGVITGVLEVPDSAPVSQQLVSVDTSNTQSMLNVGTGLEINNGQLNCTATGSVTDVQISGTSILDAQGVANITATPYLTTAPTQAYAGPGKIDVILDSEPATYYEGYMYYIKE